MSEPEWAQQARDRGLTLEEVRQGVFIVTKTVSKPVWGDDSSSSHDVNPGDDTAAPQSVSHEATKGRRGPTEN